MTRAASGSPPDRVASINSLKSSRDFSRVMRAGVRTTAGPVTVVRLANHLDDIRVGIVAGRKLGNAVTRNRVKRRIRAAVNQASLYPSFDYVIVPGPSVAETSFQDLVSSIARAGRPKKRDA